MKNKKLIKTLDDFCKKNNTEIINIGEFSGGNDSGGCSFNTELSDIDNELYEICENQLNYGSWAGNFDSSGDITYNLENKTIYITGNEIDYENKILVKNVIIPVNFENFNFDSLSVYIDYRNDGNNNNIEYNISSGFISEEMFEYLEKLNIEIDNNLNNLSNNQEVYKDTVILKKDLIENPNIILKIEENAEIEINHEINLLEYEN